ncbi:hypothetical protein P280DRAFT_511261 [Massarina eburnea CBS 473.64]|uniref:Uncharacterized protein n=1 Tax=Massarina eburnea CBS 473.64 TaxID=1395130 RepID=A0A6A6RJF4_9PLEO|nr:hypothetical protein P280DRAFT_511261 [Massarina eburnea CBS 473.64]
MDGQPPQNPRIHSTQNNVDPGTLQQVQPAYNRDMIVFTAPPPGWAFTIQYTPSQQLNQTPFIQITEDDQRHQQEAIHALGGFIRNTLLNPPTDQHPEWQIELYSLLTSSQRNKPYSDWIKSDKSQILILTDEKRTRATHAYVTHWSAHTVTRASELSDRGEMRVPPVLSFFITEHVPMPAPGKFLLMHTLIHQLLNYNKRAESYFGPLVDRFKFEVLESIFLRLLRHVSMVFILIHGFDTYEALDKVEGEQTMRFLDRLGQSGSNGTRCIVKILLTPALSKSLWTTETVNGEEVKKAKILKPSEYCKWWDVSEGLRGEASNVAENDHARDNDDRDVNSGMEGLDAEQKA